MKNIALFSLLFLFLFSACKRNDDFILASNTWTVDGAAHTTDSLRYDYRVGLHIYQTSDPSISAGNSLEFAFKNQPQAGDFTIAGFVPSSNDEVGIVLYNYDTHQTYYESQKSYSGKLHVSLINGKVSISMPQARLLMVGGPTGEIKTVKVTANLSQ